MKSKTLQLYYTYWASNVENGLKIDPNFVWFFSLPARMTDNSKDAILTQTIYYLIHKIFWIEKIMSSLGFSVGTCSPPSEQRKCRSFVSNSLTKAEAINLRSKQKVSDHELSFVQPASCGRREAIIGFGFCFGLVDTVSAFAETSSCEFSVSPSGLAFCDKVVGYGPAAVKGQLIKVIMSQISFAITLWC